MIDRTHVALATVLLSVSVILAVQCVLYALEDAPADMVLSAVLSVASLAAGWHVLKRCCR